ncbi:hypothetical protein ACFFQW_42710 [Umezawaea endophytica]|uniref:PPE family protein n=1 Tax=Umezawaea endophytica TaxID=1654476 RepID=A0A9X3A476_9PSEU|nr:hypothetical protein [Umezawaea endophytica]MCS7482564.1 hypothetical protein [Umezawaea endophytica]
MASSDVGNFFSGPVGMCVSAKAVYGWFKNGNPQAIDAGNEAWAKVSTMQADIGTLINKAVTDSGATWSGTAGDSMRSSTSPLSTWADMTSSNADSGSSAVAEIGSAFRTAQNSVQQPVEVPDKPWYNDYTPWDTDYDDAVEESQGVDEANMRVINAYADRTNYAVSTMPTFEAPPDSTAEVDDGTVNNPNGSIDKFNNNESFTNNQTSTSSTNNNPNSTTGQVSTFTPPGGNDTGGNDTGGNDDTTRPSDVDDGTTRPSDVNDPNRPPVGTPVRPPVGTPGGLDNPSGFVPFGPNDPRNPANKLNGPGNPGGGRGGGGGGAGGGRGGGLGGGAGAGAGGIGAGKGGFGPGAAAAAGQFGGAAGTAAGEGGRGGAGGFGPGGAAAGGRGAAGGAGAMGGGGHGARGEGGDDLEHSSKYLQPSDEYFGDGTMVAPPVIGG